MQLPEWLLEFEAGGALLRYASRDVDVTDANGSVYRYRAGLSNLTMQLDGLEEEQGVQVTDRTRNWAQLVVQGVGVEGRPARLLFWEPGTVLERARVVLVGRVTQSQYGAPNAPGRLVFSVRSRQGLTLYPPPSAAIDSETWTYNENVEQYDPAIEGAIYPTVFGYPGQFETTLGATLTRIATPALMCSTTGVATDLLLCIGKVDAAQVLIFDVDATDASGTIETRKSDLLDVEERTDGVGQVVSVATGFPLTPGTDDLSPVVGHRFYASWSPAAGRGGGATIGNSLIRDLVDVLLWAQRNSGRDDVDFEAQEAERSNLSQFKVDGFVNQRIDPIAWAENNLAPLFPLVRARTGQGLYWRFIDWAATPTAAVAHINADVGLATRTSALDIARGQVRNRFTIEYARELSTKSYGARRVLAPNHALTTPVDGSTAVDNRVHGSLLCGVSARRFGIIDAELRQTPLVWDTNTAELILHHWSLRDALPRVSATYQSPDVGDLRRGDVVLITDSEVGFAAVVAIVQAVRLTGARLQEVTVDVIDRSIRGAA